MRLSWRPRRSFPLFSFFPLSSSLPLFLVDVVLAVVVLVVDVLVVVVGGGVVAGGAGVVVGGAGGVVVGLYVVADVVLVLVDEPWLRVFQYSSSQPSTSSAWL